MSDFGVYDDEMLNSRFSDQDVERFFSGRVPEDEDLRRLAPVLETLHGVHRVSPTHDRVMQFAAEAAEIAASTRPEQSAPERTPSRPRRFVLALRTKAATGLAAVLLLAGTTGIAAASNGAAPSDILFGLDKALEAVGIGDGGAAERIAEARELFEEGLVADAVAHAAVAVEFRDIEVENDVEVESLGSEEASEALIAVADKLRTNTNGGEHAIEVRNGVADLLEYMATTEDTGEDFGQGVASRARTISGDEDGDTVDNTGSDAVESSGNATVEEGDSDAAENADTAEDENADSAEQADDAGPPDSAPPEDTPGRP